MVTLNILLAIAAPVLTQAEVPPVGLTCYATSYCFNYDCAEVGEDDAFPSLTVGYTQAWAAQHVNVDGLVQPLERFQRVGTTVAPRRYQLQFQSFVYEFRIFDGDPEDVVTLETWARENGDDPQTNMVAYSCLQTQLLS